MLPLTGRDVGCPFTPFLSLQYSLSTPLQAFFGRSGRAPQTGCPGSSVQEVVASWMSGVGKEVPGRVLDPANSGCPILACQVALDCTCRRVVALDGVGKEKSVSITVSYRPFRNAQVRPRVLGVLQPDRTAVPAHAANSANGGCPGCKQWMSRKASRKAKCWVSYKPYRDPQLCLRMLHVLQKVDVHEHIRQHIVLVRHQPRALVRRSVGCPAFGSVQLLARLFGFERLGSSHSARLIVRAAPQVPRARRRGRHQPGAGSRCDRCER